MTQTILIADDDASVLTVLEHAVRRRGYAPLCASDGKTLLRWVEEGRGEAVITDVRMPMDRRAPSREAESSFDWLPEIRARRPELPIIVISAQNTLNTAVQANQIGAFEYLPKPFDLSALLNVLEQALVSNAPEEEEAGAPLKHPSAALVGSSPAMQNIYRTLARVVGVDLTVMITGESGTGKELVARAVHELGPRRAKAFVAVNMAAIPRELAESELFGHEKGAFTGANARKAGKFEQAQGGTLFLDEIGDMPLEAQSKLLRVLQEGEFTPVGALKAQACDVRILCATHRDMKEMVARGEFREDLYYRLNVVPISMPPLRARKDDISGLVAHFLRKGAQKGLPEKQVSREAMARMEAHDWPGNIRELENLVYRICTLSPARIIGAEEVEAHLPGVAAQANAGGFRSLEQTIAESLEQYFSAHDGALPPPDLYARILPLIERPLILRTLAATRGNQIRAAHLLGINRNTLRKRMQELGIAK